MSLRPEPTPGRTPPGDTPRELAALLAPVLAEQKVLAEQRDRTREISRRQRVALSSGRHEQRFRRVALAAIQRRRADVGGDDQFPPPLRFEVRPLPRGELGFVVGELLVRGSVPPGRGADLLTAQGFERRDLETGHDPGPLRELVERWVNPAIEADKLIDVARRLRELTGLAASLNHLTPLGPIIKGEGGPEPTRGLRAVPRFAAAAARVPVVTVIDTGVAPDDGSMDPVRHDGWLEQVARAADTVDPLYRFSDAAAGTPGKGPDRQLDLAAGHGSFALGVIQQLAPDAELRSLRAIDSDGIGSELEVAAAMVRAAREGADVINLSLGGPSLDGHPPVALQAALDVIAAMGRPVLVVCAAGNDGTQVPLYPAAFADPCHGYRFVLAVGALSADLTPAPWSTHGPWVGISTVGEGITSTYVTGTETALADPAPDTFGGDAWAVWSGTSFAAPQVSAALAVLIRAGLDPLKARDALLSSGPKLPGYGRLLRLLPGG